MKIIATFFILIFMGINLHAQNVSIPDNVKLEDAEDYKNYEDLVLNCIDWIYTNSPEDNPAKRGEVMSFLVQWMQGCPNVSIELNESLTDLKEGELMIAFMAGWTKYSLENEGDVEKEDCYLAATEHMLNMYEKNSDSLKKGKVTKTLLKQRKKGTLKEYVLAHI